MIRGKIGTSVQTNDEVDPNIIKQQEQELRSCEARYIFLHHYHYFIGINIFKVFLFLLIVFVFRLSDIQAQLPDIENNIFSLTRECAEHKIQKDKLTIESKSLEEQIPLLKVVIHSKIHVIINRDNWNFFFLFY